MSTLRLVVAGICAIVTTTAAPIATPTASAEPPPNPVRHVVLTGDVDTSGRFSVEPTPDGRYGLLTEISGDRFRVDLVTGATVPIEFGILSAPASARAFTLSDDGRYGYVADLLTIRRVTVDTGDVTDFAVPFADFLVTRIVDSDASGRFLLLSASSGALGLVRVFLFDTQLGQLVTPEPDGVSPATKGTIVGAVGMSDDARFVTTQEALVVGATNTNLVRWDRTTDQRTTVTPPAGHDPFLGVWSASPDLQWALFPGSAAGIVPGLDASPRLYRRHIPTGQTVAVPPPYGTEAISWIITDGGRVFVELRLPTSQDGTWQVAFWDGIGQAQVLSRAPDGSLANEGISFFLGLRRASDDGRTVVFTSTSTNLVPGTPPGSFASRLFTISLPPVEVNSAAVVQPSETYCVAAVGADPGDFVGVNITPVLAAAPGFGVLHSSDDPPGSTSNVNFGPGTVDPNVAFAKVGTDGRICFTNSAHGAVHVVLDELIVADAAVFRSPSASGSVRLADTRVGLGGGIVAPSETRCVAAAGASPGEFVGVNVLPVEAAAAGFGTVHPSGTGPGASSTANFGPGTFDPNFAFTKVGADGQICFTNSVHGPVHLLLDQLIVGVSTALAAPSPGPNADRPVDTRVGLGASTLAPGASVCFAIPGGEPGDFGGVNLLPLQATGPGFGTLRSPDDAPGSTSNANFGVDTFDPNFAIAEFGADGRMCFTNSPNSTTDVIVDSQVIADASAFAQPTPTGSVRLVDTRIGRV